MSHDQYSFDESAAYLGEIPDGAATGAESEAADSPVVAFEVTEKDGARQQHAAPFSSLPAMMNAWGQREASVSWNAPAHEGAGVLVVDVHRPGRLRDKSRAEQEAFEFLSWIIAGMRKCPVIIRAPRQEDDRLRARVYILADSVADVAWFDSALYCYCLCVNRCWVALNSEGEPEIYTDATAVDPTELDVFAPDASMETWRRNGATGVVLDELKLSKHQQRTVAEREGELLLSAGTRYEQCAAIIGSADVVALAAVEGLAGEEVWKQLDRLKRAQERYHPLAAEFSQYGRAAARASKDLADDRARFDVELHSKLSHGVALNHRNAYRALTDWDAELLREAAWLFVAPPSMFVGKGSAIVGAAMRPGSSGAKYETPQWLVEGIMPQCGVGLIFGESGHGKTQIAVDLTARVVAAPVNDPVTLEEGVRRFAEHPISGAPCALVFASEGVHAWHERVERQIPFVSRRPLADSHGLFVVDGVPPLSLPAIALDVVRKTVADVRHTCGQVPAIIVIDVLRAAVTGNENDSGDMDLALATTWAIAKMCNAFVLLVHHSKKNEQTARGSGAIKGRLDLECAVAKVGEATYRATVTKNRNGPDGYVLGEWHIPGTDRPLHEGPSPTGGSSEIGIGRQCARAVASSVRRLDTGGVGVTKSELAKELKGTYPHLFEKDDRRIARGRTDAIAAEFIRWDQKQKKLFIGRVDPPAPEWPDISDPGGPLEDIE